MPPLFDCLFVFKKEICPLYNVSPVTMRSDFLFNSLPLNLED